MLSVTVNDRAVDVPAIVERGHVLLPLRTVFAALGASVAYDANHRIIVARTGSRELRLPMSSDPVRIIGGRAYVPLRFVAESLGANVEYDARMQLVRVSASNVHVIALNPAPDSSIANAFPTISATLANASASTGDVALQIDGQDVTQLATFDGSTITFLPRQGFTPGQHTVTFSGHTLSHDAFSTVWSFGTTISPPPEDPTPQFTQFDYRLYADRNAFYGGEWMHFTLIAPPGGTARLQLCNLGFEYALRNGGYGNVYQADVPAPMGYSIPSCAVRAVYTSWNGTQVYVPVPYVIAIYTKAASQATPRPTPRPTPHPTARPTPQPRHIEPVPRRPEATPAPRSPQSNRPSPHTTPGR